MLDTGPAAARAEYIGGAEVLRDCIPETGVVAFELWRRDGKPHREDGPAWIERDPATGVVTFEEWWLNGERQKPPQREAAPRP